MGKFCILILVAFFVTNSLDKAESVKVKLEELPLKTFDEIFGEGWWDKGEAAEDLKMPAPTNFGQNVHHQIDRQNGQIEHNSTDQLGQIEPNSTDQNAPLTESDHSGQIEPKSTDLDPSFTESDPSGQIKPNSTYQLGPIEPYSTDQNAPLTESDHSGQIEPKSTDLDPSFTESDPSGQIKPNSTYQLGQIEPNSTDQNPPLTESDHSDNANSSEYIAEDERKRKIVEGFHAMKDEFKQKGKYSAKEWVQIDEKIAKHLKVNRKKIYKWKKELGLSRKTGQNYSDDEKLKIVKKLMQIKSDNSGEDKKSCKEIDKEIGERFNVNVRTINRWKKAFGLSRKTPKNDRKILIEKFDQRKAELKRDGFKNSFKNGLNETVAKEMGLSDRTIYKWKRKLGQTKPKHKYSHSEQKELMKRLYKIKNKNPKISDKEITNILKIGKATLYKWKKQFERQQLDQNSVDGYFVEENAAVNVEAIGTRIREIFE